MIDGVRCLDETPHPAHDIKLTVDYPCSGYLECGNTREDHEPHRLVQTMDARCPGVCTSLN